MLVFKVPRNSFPATTNIKVGMQVAAESDHGALLSTIAKISSRTVTLDANHPLAGLNLHCEVEVVDVRNATNDELSQGRLH